MELYLLRHGIAEPRAASGQDRDRRLTPAGFAELRITLKRASASGAQPDLILASPYLRTLQTAELAASAFGYVGEIFPASALTPTSSPEEVWKEVRGFPAEERILLVTHEPLVSTTLAWLIGTTRVGKGFPTSGFACVDFENLGLLPKGRLKYMLTAAGLRD